MACLPIPFYISTCPDHFCLLVCLLICLFKSGNTLILYILKPSHTFLWLIQVCKETPKYFKLHN